MSGHIHHLIKQCNEILLFIANFIIAQLMKLIEMLHQVNGLVVLRNSEHHSLTMSCVKWVYTQ